ncbi:PqqD family protein [Phycicoccus sonneratiae]|uniref:PqqD family protein n=1 Tax=Phycicoccus sonneratiae TaxID=2807628 RepID=A0ABS2CI42_9MICO|nr:PqqD family protein [Phycicoccus sonneraticus]MBM6399148.1 PqqD family protein [Phycicoccus sonneraticus]
MSRLRVGPDTAWLEVDGVVYAAPLPDGPPVVLDGPGALVWRAVVPGGGLDDVVARVAAEAGTSAEVVAADVASFVDQLLAGGLLAHE